MRSQFIFMRPEASGKNSRILPQLRLSYQASKLLVAVFETAVIISASVFGETIYRGIWVNRAAAIDAATGTGIVASLIYVTLARSAELYNIPTLLNPARNAAKILATAGLSLLALTAILFLLKVGAKFSRGSLIAFACLELPLLMTARWMAAGVTGRLIANGAIAGRPVITIGDRNELAELSPGNLLSSFGLKEVARITIEAGGEEGRFLHARRSALDQAVAWAHASDAEEFVIATAWSGAELLSEITEALRISPLPVRLLPDHMVRSALQRSEAFTAGPLLSVEIQRAPLSRSERIAKRITDVVFAFAGILVLMPIFALAAIATKLDSKGPVIFRQRRAGFNEHQFVIYKFRTMHVLEDGDEVIQARRKDPRVTRVGRLLRAASIDELPQLFNVLKGDMSLVGPRPHALAHDDQYKKLIESYCFRHHVKPGITGWAQVNGLRGETRQLEEMRQRVEFDLWYINNWSFGLDMRILMRTCFEILKASAF